MSELSNESSNKRKGLGRGLGSLLGGEAAPAPSTKSEATPSKPNPAEAKAAVISAPEISAQQHHGDKIWTLSIEKLKSGRYQPRKEFNKESLSELAQSIREHGILQPIVARPSGAGSFEIVAGERRWRAAQAAGLHEVPVIIKAFDDQKTLELSLIENLQRQDLNPIEEAEGYQRLLSEFKLTQEQVAERVGKERATVANSLRLLKLAPEVRELLQRGQISAGHAKVLLAVTDPQLQKKLAHQVTQQHLSVRSLEGLLKSQLKPTPGPSEAASLQQANVTQRLITGLSEELQKLLGTKVTIDYLNSKGKLSVYFYSDDELSQVVEKLRNGAQS
ncbi:MAG: ParB/RepB/Spo0J family partition protein [Bdellovibrionales bacterium]